MVLGGESTRRLNVILSLQDKMSGQVKTAERNLTSFRTEVRRASITLGVMSASLGLTLRSWVQSSNEARQSITNVGLALRNLGLDPDQVLGDLAPAFQKISKETGVSITAIRENFAELVKATGSVDWAKTLLPMATGLERITGTQIPMDKLADALAGEEGAVKWLKELTGLDLSVFNTTAERLAAVAKMVADNLPKAVDPLDKFSAAFANLKAALGEVTAEQLTGPLVAVADIADRLAANPEIVNFGATFTAWAAGLSAIAVATSGAGWLLMAHPLVALAVATIAFIALLPASFAAMDAHMAKLKAQRAAMHELLLEMMHDKELIEKITGKPIGEPMPVPPVPLPGGVTKEQIAEADAIINQANTLENIKKYIATGEFDKAQRAVEGVLAVLRERGLEAALAWSELWQQILLLFRQPGMTAPPSFQPPPGLPPVQPPTEQPTFPELGGPGPGQSPGLPIPPFDPGPPPYNPGPGAPPELMSFANSAPWMQPMATGQGATTITNSVNITSMGDIDADRRIRLQVESALRAGWRT